MGCIIYELLTLNICFECDYELGLINKIINGEYDKININIYDNEYQKLIDLLLNVNQENRPDINEVLQIINNIENKLKNRNNKIEEDNFYSKDKISFNISRRYYEKNRVDENNEIIRKIPDLNNLLKCIYYLQNQE